MLLNPPTSVDAIPVFVPPLSVSGFTAYGTDWSDISEVTVASPSGLSEGDFIFATVCAGISGSTITPPEGFKPLTCVAITSGQSSTFFKIATNSEPVNYTFYTAGNTRMLAGLVRIVGVDSENPINVYAESESTGNSTSHTTPSVTTSISNCLVMSLVNGHFGNSTTYTPPAGVNELFDISHVATGDDAASMALGWANQVTAGSTGTFPWTSTFAMDRRNTTIALAPENPSSIPVVQSVSTAQKDAVTPTGSVTTTHAADDAGDLLVACVSFSGSPSSIVGPAGWTKASESLDGDTMFAVFYATAADSNPTTYAFSGTGSSSEGVVAVFTIPGATNLDDVQTGITTVPAVTQVENVSVQITMLVTGRGNDDSAMKNYDIYENTYAHLNVSSIAIGASGTSMAIFVKELVTIASVKTSGSFNPDSSNSGIMSAIFS